MAETDFLEGLRVVDFSNTLVGVQATQIMADFGATVVRVESETRPELLRAVNPFRGEDGESEGSLLLDQPRRRC